MKSLKPLPFKKEYFLGVEKELLALFQEMIFDPVLSVMEGYGDDVELKNAGGSALEAAVRDGTVWYQDGAFHGSFNARISRDLVQMGAKFNRVSSTWRVDLTVIPANIKAAQVSADSRYQDIRKNVVQVLDGIDVDYITRQAGNKFRKKYEDAIGLMNEDFQKTVRAVTIPPRLSAIQRAYIAEEWSQNLELYIKKWSKKNILALRQNVQDNALVGLRASNMVKMIQKDFGVSRNKAKFLARQETSLLMSKMREQRYKEVGINEYIWSGVDDGRERPDHIKLNGKKFNFSNPPIVDHKTGRRANPGEDYNCRCLAIPLFKGA